MNAPESVPIDPPEVVPNDIPGLVVVVPEPEPDKTYDPPEVGGE